ncbi:type IV pilus twitching motility protein PilT [bacterium]|nr:type IV pilus twitching motility protein PilT [bacterium]
MSGATLTLENLLDRMLEQKSSDLHISAGSPPQIRVDGDLAPLEDFNLTPEDAKRLCYEKTPPERIKQFEQDWELDIAIEHKGIARFRVNLFMQLNSVSGAFRHIPTEIPDYKKIGVPQTVMDLCKKPRGLVLVTGPTGSGKSTTLAAMVDAINKTEPVHIITVEDPIEFVHSSKKALVVQREVEKDTHSFGASLKRILRQDPDVVLVGEMRDLETIAAAITISETGHLVFATLHTNTAVQTINRVIDVFPPHQQPQIRTQLSFILEGVISQQLIPKKNGGRALATEILIPNPAIRNLIREDKIHQLYSAMQIGRDKTGMHTMTQSLTNLVNDGSITKERALEYATEYEELKKMLGM